MHLTPQQKIILEDSPELLAEFIPDVKDGEKGDIGERGEKGDKGDTGEAGKDGKDGVDGKDGIDGKNGRDGRDGIDGLDGKDGKKGDKGDDGKDAILDEKLLEPIIEKFNTGMAKLDGRVKLIDQRWHGAGLSRVSTDATLTGDGTPSNPLSAVHEVGNFLKLDQTTPQTFTGGSVTGTGLLQVVGGVLGKNVMLTVSATAPTNPNVGDIWINTI